MDNGTKSGKQPSNKSGSARFWLIACGLAALAVTAGWLIFRGEEVTQAATFTVRKGNLPITVLQGGTVKSLKAQLIRSEIKGREGTKILSIVEEGYLVTEDDVKAGKILVELDSAELVQNVTSQEIQFQSTQASLIEAQQSLEIQLIQNQSDLKAAEQKARFAYLDFAKYMGAELADEITEFAGLDLESTLTNQPVLPNLAQISAAATATPSWAIPSTTPTPGPDNVPPGFGQPGDGRPVEGGERRRFRRPDGEGGAEGAPSFGERGFGGGQRPPDGERPPGGGRRARGDSLVDEGRGVRAQQFLPPVEEPRPAPLTASTTAESNTVVETAALLTPTVKVDFPKYLETGKVGDGEARQKLREFEDSLLLAEAELGLSKTKFTGTQQLFDKGFVTQSDLDRDKVSYDKSELSVQKGETALALFKTYDFSKQAEQLLAAYEESLRLLMRTKKESISKNAQAEAKVAAAQSRYRLEKFQLEDWQSQLSKCVIRATTPGLVVYANDGERRGPQEPIQEGTAVRERQQILTIPDMTQMAVEIKVHESHIQRITKGLPARVQVEAYPEEPLVGEVSKVALVPDSQDRWMNPDLKVYPTTVGVLGSFPWLKPGMSAKVEIVVKELANVIYVPLQAISFHAGQRVAYIAKSGGQPERRVVLTGEFSDQFIEIKEGLSEGEVVLLLAPKYLEPAESQDAAPAPEGAETVT